tara:strand:- start:2160 stop:2567 length:408 start_codon:yes stop_codon:yes gene_type:complete
MKKKDLSFYLLIGFFLILINQIDVLKKTYFVLNKNYNTRFEDAYKNDYFSGFCKKESHGYVHYIKKKFNLIYSPKIINFEKKKRKLPYWLFYKPFNNINKNELILLSYREEIQFNFKNYNILDKHENRCFYLKKK